jgi:hypothetical protein
MAKPAHESVELHSKGTNKAGNLDQQRERIDIDHEVYTEPAGVSLKAAWLLLREMEHNPKLPTVEQLALLLDKVLKYDRAVRLIMFEVWRQSDADEDLVEFDLLAYRNLVG